MTHDQYQNARDHMLGAVSEVAPGVSYSVVEHLVDQMEEDGLPQEEVLKALVGMVHDGIVHGNWPEV